MGLRSTQIYFNLPLLASEASQRGSPLISGRRRKSSFAFGNRRAEVFRHWAHFLVTLVMWIIRVCSGPPASNRIPKPLNPKSVGKLCTTLPFLQAWFLSVMLDGAGIMTYTGETNGKEYDMETELVQGPLGRSTYPKGSKVQIWYKVWFL